MFKGSKKLRSEGREGGWHSKIHGGGKGGEVQTTNLVSVFLIFQTNIYSSNQFLSVCLRAIKSCAVKIGRMGSTARYREGVGWGGADYEPDLFVLDLSNSSLLL